VIVQEYIKRVSLTGIIAVTLTACGNPAGSRDEMTVPPVQRAPRSAGPRVEAESDVDRTIRVQLDKSFSMEPGLKDRNIAFTVADGDVTFTGAVRSKAERERTNEVAMSVPGVKSVANALRISP
jgi:osmotically-inducible protein OsmY